MKLLKKEMIAILATLENHLYLVKLGDKKMTDDLQERDILRPWNDGFKLTSYGYFLHRDITLKDTSLRQT